MRASPHNKKGVDVIFFSACDHNEGTDNHGLFQMFKFFKENEIGTSIYINSLSSLYSNNIDVFNCDYLGGQIPLAYQINTTLRNPNILSSWEGMSGNSAEGERTYLDKASQTIIDNLPDHKFIAIADKSEMDLRVLERVLRHFGSKLLILSAVNNTWTGHCSYPDEFKCDKYKSNPGCNASCPALVGNTDVDPSSISLNFSQTRLFVEQNLDSIYLNIGNSFSMREASDSLIFKDVKKVLIPLKNIETEEDFQKLWDYKQRNRAELLNTLAKYEIQDISFCIFWAAQYMGMKRKGLDYLIESLSELKLTLGDRFSDICLIVSAKPDDKYHTILRDLGVKYAFTGFLDNRAYNSLMSACDVYCCTTLSDAGPRTNYESAALATPVISFDKSNAADFVTNNNGALVETGNVKELTEAIRRFVGYDDCAKKGVSLNMHETYKEHMRTETLVAKWKSFFAESTFES